jgi:hypothetical protein
MTDSTKTAITIHVTIKEKQAKITGLIVVPTSVENTAVVKK